MSETDCSNIPIKLKIATADEDLYDNKTNHWNWNGTMYWAVQCLDHKQTRVSDKIIPKILPENYKSLLSSPSNLWNFCSSEFCTIHTDTFQIVFTFNPQSKNPNDFLQFIIDAHSRVTSRPIHHIRDDKGNLVHLDIDKISKPSYRPFVEIWLTSTEPSPKDIIQEEIGPEFPIVIPTPLPLIELRESSGLGIGIGIFILLLIILSIILGIYYYIIKDKKGVPPTTFASLIL